MIAPLKPAKVAETSISARGVSWVFENLEISAVMRIVRIVSSLMGRQYVRNANMLTTLTVMKSAYLVNKQVAVCARVMGKVGRRVSNAKKAITSKTINVFPARKIASSATDNMATVSNANRDSPLNNPIGNCVFVTQ